MYGDLQFTNSNTGNKWKGASKVYKYEAINGIYETDFLVGYSGTAQDIVTVHSYFSYPEMYPKPPPSPRNLTGLVLTADKNIFIFTHYMKWLAVREPFHAIGSGMDYALGAMAAGLSPKESVKVAMKHDVWTGLGLKGFSFAK